jgi:hypothetical protein
MSNKSYYKMIKLHSNKFSDTMNNDNKFSPFIRIHYKTLLETAVIYDNFDAYTLMIKQTTFKSLMSKPEQMNMSFIINIAERISECEWERNKRYLDILFDINYNFTHYHLDYFRNNYNIFMEIFNRINNIDYKKLLERIDIFDDNIKLELLEIIIKYYKTNNIPLTINNFKYCILSDIRKGNINCLEIISKNGYDISMIDSKPIIYYIFNKYYGKFNEYLINYFLSQKWHYNLNFFDYIEKGIIKYYTFEIMLVNLSQNHNKLKIQFETIKDNDNFYFISYVTYTLINFNNIYYNKPSRKNLLQIIKSFYYFLKLAEENNVTNMIESLPIKFYNKSLEIYNNQNLNNQSNNIKQLKCCLKEFMSIMLASKQTQTEDFKNLILYVFTEDELKQISTIIKKYNKNFTEVHNNKVIEKSKLNVLDNNNLNLDLNLNSDSESDTESNTDSNQETELFL